MRIIILFFLFAPGCAGQSAASARLSGIVTDPSARAVPGATVKARSSETGFTYSALTSEAGYVLPNLAPGAYEVSVEAANFIKAAPARIHLTVGQQATLNFKLDVEGSHSALTVTSETPLIEATRTDESQAIEELRINNLPINGRNFFDFVLLTPNVSVGRSDVGAVARPNEPNEIDLSFGGLPEVAGLVTVDGANNMNSLFARPRATPSQEGVREFRVLTGSYGADIGPAAGAVVNIVTKSGTNDLHGSLYYYFRNNALDANNLLAADGLNELRQNQFGFTMGGPAVKNKLFYFANYEGQRRAESPFYSSVLIDNLGAINAAKGALNLPPEVLTGHTRQYNYDTGLFRADAQINNANLLSVSYRVRNESDLNVAATSGQFSAPSDFRNASILDQVLTANLTTSISPSVANQALLQFAYRRFDFPSLTYQPDLSISNTLEIGRLATAPDGTRESRFEGGDALNWVHRSHSFRFGGDADLTRDTYLLDTNDPAYVVYPDLNTFLGSFPVVFSFLAAPDGSRPNAPAGIAGFANASLASLNRTVGNFEIYSLFFQDTWQATSKLTVNYGLRWEGYHYPTQILNPYYKAFLPRVGLAYSLLNNRMVLRAGSGIYQGTNDAIHTLGSEIVGAHPDALSTPAGYSTSPGSILSPSFNGPTAAIPALLQFVNSGGVYPALVPGTYQNFILATNKYDSRQGYAYSWNASAEAALTSNLALTVGYSGVRGLNLATGNNFNVAPAHLKLADGENNYAISSAIPVPGVLNPTLSSLSLFFEQDGQSTYHSLYVTLNRKLTSHVAATLNYTFSKTIDDMGSDAFNDDPQDPYNRHLERAISKQDVPERLVGMLTGDWKGYRLSTIFTAQSPQYYTVYAGVDKNNDGNTLTDRVGQVGRDTYQGTKLVSLDVRVSRVFRLTDRIHLEALAEAFNIANTLNVRELNTVYGAASLIGAQPVSYGDKAIAPLATFGSIQAIAPPRQIQLALKLGF